MPVEQLEEESGFALCPCHGLFQLVGISIHDGRPRQHTPLRLPPSFSVSSAATEASHPGNGGTIAAGERSAAYREAAPKRELSVTWPIDDGRLLKPVLWILPVFLWLMVALASSQALGGGGPSSPYEKGSDPRIGTFIVLFLGPPALACAYLLLVALTNRSSLTIREGMLHVHHGPFRSSAT